MKNIRLAVVLNVIMGCSAHSPALPAHDLPPREDLSAQSDRADNFSTIALRDFRDAQNYLVGIDANGASSGAGDAALRTSLVLLSLSCDDSMPLLSALVKSIADYNGMIPRHDPNVGGANGPTSRDQVTGVALAFVDRWQRCPGDREAIKAAWQSHVDYVKATGRLGPSLDGELLTFHWVWGAVGQYFGTTGAGGGSKQEWEAGLYGTASDIKLRKRACYPIHIGTLQLVLAARIGKPTGDTARGLYCAATDGLKTPLTDWYCRRASALSYLKAFVPDVWQLQTQRCPDWESPDAGTSRWPSVGFLEVYGLAK